MAKTTGKLHLGNCNRFTSAFIQPQRGNVLPAGVYYRMGSVLVGHKLYVCGGFLGIHVHGETSFLVCDLNTWKWNKTTLRQQPTNQTPMQRSVSACFIHKDTILVFGVVHGSDVSLKAFALDLVRGDEWEGVRPAGLPTVSHHACGTYHEQREEAFFSDGGDFYVFRADENRVRLQETKGAKPGLRRYHACCTSPYTFFLFEDEQGDPALHALSLATMTLAIADIKSQYTPGRRHKFTMSYLDGRIFVMGGYPSRLRSAQLDVFEVKQQRWKSIHSSALVGSNDKLDFEGETRRGTRSHTAVATRDRLLIIGGHGKAFMDLMVMEVAPAEP